MNESSLLEAENDSKKADLLSSAEKKAIKQITDSTNKLKITDTKFTSPSHSDEVEATGEVKASYAATLNDPFKNVKTIRVVRYTVSDEDGSKDYGLPGMSKDHFEGKFLPELESSRRKINLVRIKSNERPFKALRACKYVKGKPNSKGEPQPNHGLLVPFDDENSMWLLMQIAALQLQQGTEGTVYRYTARKAFEAGKGSVILSFKVSKLGSDVSKDSWELFCHDNAIDSAETRMMEPRFYPGEIEAIFAATKTLVQKLKTTDVETGRPAGHVAFGMQGMKELHYKTKPLMSKSMDQLDFIFGHL